MVNLKPGSPSSRESHFCLSRVVLSRNPKRHRTIKRLPMATIHFSLGHPMYKESTGKRAWLLARRALPLPTDRSSWISTLTKKLFSTGLPPASSLICSTQDLREASEVRVEALWVKMEDWTTFEFNRSLSSKLEALGRWGHWATGLSTDDKSSAQLTQPSLEKATEKTRPWGHPTIQQTHYNSIWSINPRLK